MKLVDYKCHKCHTVEERFVDNEDELQFCDCGYTMYRKAGAPGMVKTNFADKTGFKTRKKNG